MAENDSKRFYWLKLKKDFFQQHQIKVLKSLPNGRLYALIYLELLAESCSHNGELRYSQLMPYDVVTLSSVIDEDKDNVQNAIDTLVNLELVEILDDKTIYMREIEKLIGSETGQTIRKREAKLSGGKSLVKNTLENRDKSKEIRVKSIESIRHKHGEYKHVLLTEEQYEKLLIDLGQKNLEEYIKKVDEYCQQYGKSYKDYNLTIRKWFKNDHKEANDDYSNIITNYDTSNNPKLDLKRFEELERKRKNDRGN